MTPGLRHGDPEALLISDHTSRLARMETSYQEILPIVSQTQTVIMGIHEALQEIKSDVKDLKQGHEDVSQNLLKYGQRIDILDRWKEEKEISKQKHRDLIKKTVFRAVAAIIAGAVIFFLGWK